MRAIIRLCSNERIANVINMPVRTRITGQAERIDLKRKAKGRHPLLKVGSRHSGIWQTIVNDGNPKHGITAAQIRGLNHMYHPQILKDLLDYRLVKVVGKNASGENIYIGDPNGHGTYMQQVTVEVELLEDESGKFFTRTKLQGRTTEPGRIIRSLGTRKMHFNVPLPEEPGVIKVAGDVRVDPMSDLPLSRNAKPLTIDAEATEQKKTEVPLLLEATATIIEG